MRGPKGRPFRAGYKAPPNPPQAREASITAPVGGWNAKNSIAAMPPAQAIVMDNFFPGTAAVELRGGKSSWATGLSGGTKALLPYQSASGTKTLFASTSTGIYNVTAAGTVGAAVTTCTNGKFNSINFTTGGTSYLLLANGTDAVKSWNGAVWALPAITVVSPSAVNNLCVFKHRIWMIANNSMDAWYLPTDAIAGAAVAFPMGQLFQRGGYLVAQTSWTFDGGNGPDDYFVTVTSEGELAVYQGTDPASAATWSLVGVYYVGRPLGSKCFMRYGGDVLYLSHRGVGLLSKYLQAVEIQRSTDLFSDNIDGAFSEAVQLYRNNFGWSADSYDEEDAILINVPVSEGALSYQFVMNSVTKAWCRFTGWNLSCLAQFNGSIYGALDGTIYKLWTGYDDSGTAINGRVAQAYNRFGMVGGKKVNLIRPIILFSGAATIQYGLDTDFLVLGDNSSLTFSLNSSVNVWDTGLWDSSVWQDVDASSTNAWSAIPNNPGFALSFRLQVTTSNATIAWTATDYVLEQTGAL